MTATVEMASVHSGFETRDDKLRSAHLFDMDRFPQATFTSTEITWAGSRGEMTGDLTIKDVTRPISRFVILAYFLGMSEIETLVVPAVTPGGMPSRRC